MPRKFLPILMILVALTVTFGVLFATQRMGRVRPSLDRFMKMADDLPVDEAEPIAPEA
jgi:hypothetical protein